MKETPMFPFKSFLAFKTVGLLFLMSNSLSVSITPSMAESISSDVLNSVSQFNNPRKHSTDLSYSGDIQIDSVLQEIGVDDIGKSIIKSLFLRQEELKSSLLGQDTSEVTRQLNLFMSYLDSLPEEKSSSILRCLLPVGDLLGSIEDVTDNSTD